MESTSNTDNFFHNSENSSWVKLKEELSTISAANNNGQLSMVLVRQLFIMLDFLSRFYVGSLSHTATFKRLRIYLSEVGELTDEQCTLLILCRNTALHGGGNLIGTTGKSGYSRLLINNSNEYLVKRNKSIVGLSLPMFKTLVLDSAASFKKEIESNEKVARRFNKVYRLIGQQ